MEGVGTRGLSLSSPRFQPWEKRAWWWSRIKEPPLLEPLALRVRQHLHPTSFLVEKSKVRTSCVGYDLLNLGKVG